MTRPTLPPEVAAGVRAILGGQVRVVEELTPAWARTTRSVLVGTRAEEGRFVVQWSIGARAAGRRAMGRRLRLGRELARLAPRLPVPEVLGGDGHGPTPYVVSRFVAGTSGRDLLDDDAHAPLVGTATGRVAREIARVPAAGLRLSRTWADSDRLAAAARRWLEEAGAHVGAEAADAVRGIIERLPDRFAGVRPAFAHGDLAPVNLLIRDDAVVALLDLERARLAHPLFDAAWWSWIIRYHHPARWPAAGRAFLAEAGIERSAGTLAQLNGLAVLQCLEMLAGTPARETGTRREWADRVARVLEWSDDDVVPPIEPPPARLQRAARTPASSCLSRAERG
jgi:aminoglycoside phosphotransferase (APT) family kinase protein